MIPGQPCFWLGTHEPSWLERVKIPLFISRRRFDRIKRLPRALGPWALDSGGFTELSMHGRFELSATAYADHVRRYRDEIGGMVWAAPQDWMCEPQMIARTGLSVEEHQRRTVANYLDLQAAAPDLPWVPVLQGWSMWSYLRCADLYLAAGVDLAALPLVGVGSVCRRQASATVAGIFALLAGGSRLRLHGFGVKTAGLRAAAGALVSADSMAWSAAARREPPLAGHRHRNCANCLEFALAWRECLPGEWIGARAA